MSIYDRLLCLNNYISPVLSRNWRLQMEDPSRKTVWGRFGSPLLGHEPPKIGKMRFGSCEGEVASPPSLHRLRTNFLKRKGALKDLQSVRWQLHHGFHEITIFLAQNLCKFGANIFLQNFFVSFAHEAQKRFWTKRKLLRKIC